METETVLAAAQGLKGWREEPAGIVGCPHIYQPGKSPSSPEIKLKGGDRPGDFRGHLSPRKAEVNIYPLSLKTSTNKTYLLLFYVYSCFVAM